MVSFSKTFSGALCDFGTWYRALPPSFLNAAILSIFWDFVHQFLKIWMSLVEIIYLPSKLSYILIEHYNIIELHKKKIPGSLATSNQISSIETLKKDLLNFSISVISVSIDIIFIRINAKGDILIHFHQTMVLN